MNENKIKDLIGGIEFSEETKKHILNGVYIRKTGQYKKKLVRLSVSIVGGLCLLIIINIFKKDTFDSAFTVYAVMSEDNKENIALSPGKEKNLTQMETPVGLGYIFKLDLQEGYTFECIPEPGSKNIFTVYQRESDIYWIPKQKIQGEIYSDNGEKLIADKFPKEESIRFLMRIYNGDREVTEQKTVEFKITDSQCSVTLK